MLSNRLQRLVDDGLLDRGPYGGTVRPRVEYVLTHAGEDTLPVLHALARWGRRHTTSPFRAPDPAHRVRGVRAAGGECRLVHHLRDATRSWPHCLAPRE